MSFLTLRFISGAGFYMDHDKDELKCQFPECQFIGDMFFKPLLDYFVKTFEEGLDLRFRKDEVVNHMNMALRMTSKFGCTTKDEIITEFLLNSVIRDLYKYNDGKLMTS